MQKLLIALGAALLLASCVATPSARIASRPQGYEALSSRHKDLVRQGKIDRGMPKDAVWYAWGDPDRKYDGTTKGKFTERWDYFSSQPTYTAGFGLGYTRFRGYPYRGYGYGMDFGPELVYVPYRSGTVIFSNGKVDSWERVR